MFLRLLWESFARQRRRKLLAGIAILLGTTAVTAMLALATTIGDRIHRELAVYGANIVVFPKAEQLDVKIGGVDIKPATGGAYLKESDLEKLKTIFWANNITGVSPELSHSVLVASQRQGSTVKTTITGMWFDHPFGNLKTGAPSLHPWWKLDGTWPQPTDPNVTDVAPQAVLGSALAKRLNAKPGENFFFSEAPNAPLQPMHIAGVVTSGDKTDDAVLVLLSTQQSLTPLPGGYSDPIDRVDISARTKPEDAFARRDPDTMSGPTREIWYCRPYANSIAYQIREAIPGAQAEQVRRVEQTEGTVLERISGLMWLVSGAALLAAGFAVSAAMATAVLERRREIGLMRSLGASKAAIATLFYAESGLLAIVAGTIGYLAGSLLAFWLGARIFPGDGTAPLLNFVLLPVVVAMALIVAMAGATPSIRKALSMDPSAVLRVDA
jgi:putative ABC transport system permease protein